MQKATLCTSLLRKAGRDWHWSTPCRVVGGEDPALVPMMLAATPPYRPGAASGRVCRKCNLKGKDEDWCAFAVLDGTTGEVRARSWVKSSTCPTQCH